MRTGFPAHERPFFPAKGRSPVAPTRLAGKPRAGRRGTSRTNYRRMPRADCRGRSRIDCCRGTSRTGRRRSVPRPEAVVCVFDDQRAAGPHPADRPSRGGGPVRARSPTGPDDRLNAFGRPGTGTAIALTVLTRLMTGGLPYELSYELHQLGGFEGFREKGIDAGGLSAVDFRLRAGADDGEGQVPSTYVVPQASGGPQSVETGHGHVESDHVGPHPMHDLQTLDTVSRGHDLEPLKLKVDPD